MENNQNVVVNRQLANALLRYLAARPYQEVADLIGHLSQAMTHANEGLNGSQATEKK